MWFKKKTAKETEDKKCIDLIKNPTKLKELFNTPIQFETEEAEMCKLMDNILDLIYNVNKDHLLDFEYIKETLFFKQRNRFLNQKVLHEILMFFINRRAEIEYLYLLNPSLVTNNDLVRIFSNIDWCNAEEPIMYMFRNFSNTKEVVSNIHQFDMSKYIMFNENMRYDEIISFTELTPKNKKYTSNLTFAMEYSKYEDDFWNNYLEYYNSGESHIFMETMLSLSDKYEHKFIRYYGSTLQLAMDYIHKVDFPLHQTKQTIDDLVEEIFASDDIICVLNLFIEEISVRDVYDKVILESYKQERRDVSIYIEEKMRVSLLEQQVKELSK